MRSLSPRATTPLVSTALGHLGAAGGEFGLSGKKQMGLGAALFGSIPQCSLESCGVAAGAGCAVLEPCFV